MPKVSLVWVEEPGLEGIDPQAVAKANGIKLSPKGIAESAVVSVPMERAPIDIRANLAGMPVKWLDLAAEVGGGSEALRTSRASAAVARAAGSAALGAMGQVYAPQPVLEVLVAGKGLAGLSAAYEIAALGHPVLLAMDGTRAQAGCGDDKPGEVKRLLGALPAGVEVAIKTELTRLKGGGGGFYADLQGPQGTTTQRFGAVVLAPPSSYQVIEALAVDPEITVSLSDLKAKDYQGQGDAWFQAVVMTALDGSATAAGFSRALAKALALQKRPQVQVTMFLAEALVASEGGERLYRQAREAGVLMVRTAKGEPKVNSDNRTLRFMDQILGEELELRPDLVVAAEETVGQAPAWLDNPMAWTAWDQDLGDHPRLQAGRTARTGLYLIGGARGTLPGADRKAEAAACAADVHDLLSGKTTHIPAVRTLRCAHCLTCVRVCPHGVLRHPEDQILTAPAACLACGLCAAQCPAEAITPPGWSNNEMFAGLKAGLAAIQGAPLVLFACQGSAMDAARQLSLDGHQWPQGLLMVPLNCAGRVSDGLILKALEYGAGGVLVAGCHDGNCRSLNGNLWAKLEAARAADLFARVGGSIDQVRFMHLASNQPGALARAVHEMAGESK